MKSLTHTAKLRLVLLLAMALLSSQLGAQAHAYSHLRTGSHVANPLDYHVSPCADCLSFAPLLATAGGPSHAVMVSSAGAAAAPDALVQTLTTPTATYAFRSRAPPSNR